MTKLEYVRCDICSRNNEELFMEAKNTHGSYLISDERFRVVKCKNCGLVYINPRPVRELINKYYDDCNYYLSGNSPKAFIERVLTHYFISVKKNMILRFKKAGRMLDIGCGDGSFLASFSLDNKWEIYGIEPNPIGYKISKQKVNRKDNIFNKELLDCDFPNNYFDIVTMWHVFEHLYDPNEELQEVSRILKDDGLLITGIPNIKSLGFKVSREKWFHLDAPRHLHYYDPTTINKILNKNGFKILKVAFPFAEYPLDLYHSLIHSLGKNKFIRISLVLPVLAFSLLLKPLGSSLKASETMVVFCRKGV